MIIITMQNDKQIKLELDRVNAPNTVNNFVYLANKGYMIQGGDPTGTGSGGPGYTIKGEFKANGFKNELKHHRGVISMARTMAPNSAGSQFFIMHKDAPHLDGQYAAFGKVIEGIEVVDEIASTRCDYYDRPLQKQIITHNS